ncbi:MAG: hypothetical protein ACKVY0_07045 [Prosthecobacter sp.]|uniref:hypothetical protein n=1 Tax=Prosthecobacter sp. TaxID=1965333 RepID=UPI0039036F1F
MPQLTIDLPETIMPALTRKAEGWQQTPESFLSSYVVLCLENDEQPAADPAREALEDILEERDKGPFVPVPDDLVERVMRKAMARIQQREAHV